MLRRTLSNPLCPSEFDKKGTNCSLSVILSCAAFNPANTSHSPTVARVLAGHQQRRFSAGRLHHRLPARLRRRRVHVRRQRGWRREWTKGRAPRQTCRQYHAPAARVRDMKILGGSRVAVRRFLLGVVTVAVGGVAVQWGWLACRYHVDTTTHNAFGRKYVRGCILGQLRHGRAPRSAP